jgi:hypothetical protein
LVEVSIGVSNFHIEHLEEIKAAGLPMPEANQIELHPWSQKPELIVYMRDNNIAPIAYSSLAPLSTWRVEPGQDSAKTEEMKELMHSIDGHDCWRLRRTVTAWSPPPLNRSEVHHSRQVRFAYFSNEQDVILYSHRPSSAKSGSSGDEIEGLFNSGSRRPRSTCLCQQSLP